MIKVADLHYGNGGLTRCRDVLESEFRYCTDLNSTQFLRRMIQAEKPDLIAFTGTCSFWDFLYFDRPEMESVWDVYNSLFLTNL